MGRKNQRDDSDDNFGDIVLIIAILFLFGVPQRTFTRFYPNHFNANYAGKVFEVKKIKNDLILLKEQRDAVFPSLNGRWFYKKEIHSKLWRSDVQFKMTPDSVFISQENNF